MNGSTADQHHVHCLCTENEAGRMCCCECGCSQRLWAVIQVIDIMREIKDQVGVDGTICKQILRGLTKSHNERNPRIQK